MATLVIWLPASTRASSTNSLLNEVIELCLVDQEHAQGCMQAIAF
jgi:hypothetical protein